MNRTEFKTIRHTDYQPPDFLVDSIDLVFQLDERKTVVTATSHIKRNSLVSNNDAPLTLYGEKLELNQVMIDGVEVGSNRMLLAERDLQIFEVPDEFSLEIITTINPEANTSLSGLYLSSSIFCTQCEAQGFRKITYYPDRPDVLARYTTRIEADRRKYPVLLSNGNLIEQGALDDDRHYTVWQDPFPKPSYLFALVGGDLIHEHDSFTTMSGRQVDCYIYTEARNRGTCKHAMKSLKQAMRWDEEVFGLEYDLDRYMIVAVDDFNMGAMENKGLNIFNSKYVLASPETATDQDYLNIQGVIAHEYFHNWTGNRVTCRDWFQLSLKEGLTVFRDQQFSADMNSRPVQRIKDVRLLRQYQFREDEGPMAHPVRPETYIEINNFYTVTVYNKGAEVVRMIHTLIGADAFRAGMDLYFERHDGQAVTCDDFVAAMADASGRNLDQFKRWYSQAGTPVISCSENWDESSKTYELRLSQQTPPTPGQPEKQPFHLPILIGLLDHRGKSMIDKIEAPYEKRDDCVLLELAEPEQIFTFAKVTSKPVVSLLRSFSAPVKIEISRNLEETALLTAFDSDLFNRWDNAYRLSTSMITGVAADIAEGSPPDSPRHIIAAARELLVSESGDNALTALALQLPEEAYLALSMESVNPDHLHEAHRFVKNQLVDNLHGEFLNCYHRHQDQGCYSIDPAAIGARSLKNTCLDYLLSARKIDAEAISLAGSQYYHATNMTDRIGVLGSVTHLEIDLREKIFADFEEKWQSNPLVIDKWFTLQALSAASDTYAKVVKLLEHPSFSLQNPNKVRALVGAFCQNHFHFHHSSGRGYDFLADIVLQLDKINPQVAARMAGPLISYRRYEPRRKEMMIDCLKRIRSTRKLSRDVYEIVSKGLKEE
ncbi:MAG: aminopeptidase N [Desulfofustis sp.]